MKEITHNKQSKKKGAKRKKTIEVSRSRERSWDKSKSPVHSSRNDQILVGLNAGNKHLNRNRWRQVSPTFYNNAIGASSDESQRLILFKKPENIAPPRSVMEQLPQIQEFEFAGKKTEGCQTTPIRTIQVTFDVATKFKPGTGESSFHLNDVFNSKLIASQKSSFRQSVAIPFTDPIIPT